MPPAPMPWMERPLKSAPMLGAVAHTMDPMVNITTEEIRSIGRPNISEIAARNGMLTDVESKYAVPTQKP